MKTKKNKSKVTKLTALLSLVTFTASFNASVYGAEQGLNLQQAEKNVRFNEYVNSLETYSEDTNRQVNGYIPTPYELPHVSPKEQVFNLPDKYVSIPDYNIGDDKEFISPVKDQGADNICWAFSSLGVLESSLLKQNRLTDVNTYDFSENHMRHALSDIGNNKLGFWRDPNGAGNFDMALAYLTRDETNGPVLEINDIFKENDAERDISVTNSIAPEDYYVTSSIKLTASPEGYTPEDKKYLINRIKELVLEYGSVTLSYYSDDNYYDNPYNPTNYYYNGTESLSNHAVAIVGWDDNYSKENFKVNPPNDGAFLIKNSWGEIGTLGGYFYLSYDDKFSISDINVITGVESKDFYDNLYEYDPFGSIGIIGLSEAKGLNTYANVFECKTGNEILTAISTYTIVPCYLEFYVSKDGNFENFTRVGVQDYVYEQDAGYAINDSGYYTFKLEEPIEITNDKFAIAIETVNPFGIVETVPVEHNADFYLTQATQNTNESFVTYTVNDLSANNYIDLANRDNPSNACIKAFTLNKADMNYNIKVDTNITGGTIETNVANAPKGTEIELTIKPNSGMKLKENSLRYSYDNKNYIINNNTFKMPASDVMVYAEFVDTDLSKAIKKAQEIIDKEDASTGELIKAIKDLANAMKNKTK